jgi:NADPH:quinone reductase
VGSILGTAALEAIGVDHVLVYNGDVATQARAIVTDVLQAYLDAVEAGRLTVPIHRTYALDEIAQAHADMEHGRAMGRLVVLP